MCVANGVLTIKGQKRIKERGTGNFHRRERCLGSFKRTFTIPDSVDTRQMKARFRRGVLTLTLPKAGNELLEQRPNGGRREASI
jgi:HSP20 family protein